MREIHSIEPKPAILVVRTSEADRQRIIDIAKKGDFEVTSKLGSAIKVLVVGTHHGAPASTLAHWASCAGIRVCDPASFIEDYERRGFIRTTDENFPDPDFDEVLGWGASDKDFADEEILRSAYAPGERQAVAERPEVVAYRSFTPQEFDQWLAGLDEPRTISNIDRAQIAAFAADQKATNPKDAVGTLKFRQFACVPMTVMNEVGIGMLEGARKYGRHNYRVAGVAASVYVDAAIGHIMQWWEGEDIDADSGLSHITKAMCSLVVLRDAMIQDMLNDDRPPKAKLAGWREAMQKVVNGIFERHPEPKAPYREN